MKLMYLFAVVNKLYFVFKRIKIKLK